MFIYSFTNYAGHDRVFHSSAKIPKKHKIGDLLWVNEQYGVLLGEDISFIEQYKTKRNDERKVLEHYPTFFSLTTLEIIHRMVYNRYTSYKKVMPLYISNDIDYLIKKHNKKKKVIHEHRSVFSFENNKISLGQKKEDGQQLIVFPDLRSLYNMIDTKSLPDDVAILSSQSTANQKSKVYRAIKNNEINVLITTHAGIFQDWNNLTEIVMIHPNRWYYSNQQEPRYKTLDVLKKFSETYGSTIKLVD